MAKRTETVAKKKAIEHCEHRAEIAETAIDAYRGTVSLPYSPRKHGRVVVKIADDRV